MLSVEMCFNPGDKIFRLNSQKAIVRERPVENRPREVKADFAVDSMLFSETAFPRMQSLSALKISNSDSQISEERKSKSSESIDRLVDIMKNDAS